MHRLLRPSLPALLIALALALPSAALTLDFEDLGLNLPVESDGDAQFEENYDNRYSALVASQPTAFSSSGATFSNFVSDDFGCCYWEGWAYSQTSDTATPGFGNQYSAFPGAGAGGSATYGVAHTPGGPTETGISRIAFDAPVSVLSADLTNTTYAALSMQTGDAFAKKFGGASGDDADYFLLTITGRDAGNTITGTVEFVLADYRFADNQDDYIVNQWTAVDLSGLGWVAALEFALTSSDVGQFGMNTPAYFALDNLTFVPEPGSAALLALGLALLARRRS